MTPTRTPFRIPAGPAVCYSGYRAGQSPADQTYPTLAQIREDLHLLSAHWRLLRLYDCSLHAQRVLQVIEQDQLPLQVLLGAHLAAELSNPNCPWGGTYSDAELAANRLANEAELARLVHLANQHQDTVWAVAVGNEALVDWTDHKVPVPRVTDAVRRVKAAVRQPVTVCDNYVPWQSSLQGLVAAVDFISLHTYPLWEYKTVDDALAYTQANVASVATAHPGKPIVITEAGWCTASNGRGMPAAHANPAWQARHCQALIDWTQQTGLLCFLFEAFDEPWKGSSDPLEPEKHWGLYTLGRKPKPVMQALFPDPATG